VIFSEKKVDFFFKHYIRYNTFPLGMERMMLHFADGPKIMLDRLKNNFVGISK